MSDSCGDLHGDDTIRLDAHSPKGRSFSTSDDLLQKVLRSMTAFTAAHSAADHGDCIVVDGFDNLVPFLED